MLHLQSADKVLHPFLLTSVNLISPYQH